MPAKIVITGLIQVAQTIVLMQHRTAMKPVLTAAVPALFAINRPASVRFPTPPIRLKPMPLLLSRSTGRMPATRQKFTFAKPMRFQDRPAPAVLGAIQPVGRPLPRLPALILL